jgi:hypothetical protein
MAEKTKKPARPRIVTQTLEELRKSECPQGYQPYRVVLPGATRYCYAGSRNGALFFTARVVGTADRLDRLPSAEQVLASFQALTPEDQAILIARLHAADGSAAGPAPAAPRRRQGAGR